LTVASNLSEPGVHFIPVGKVAKDGRLNPAVGVNGDGIPAQLVAEASVIIQAEGIGVDGSKYGAYGLTN
jgi:hypothetical protein